MRSFLAFFVVSVRNLKESQNSTPTFSSLEPSYLKSHEVRRVVKKKISSCQSCVGLIVGLAGVRPSNVGYYLTQRRGDAEFFTTRPVPGLEGTEIRERRDQR